MPRRLTFEDYDMAPDPDQIRAIYESGFQGVLRDPFESAFAASLFGAEDFYEAFPLARNLGKGKLVTPYKAALALEPEFGRYEAQTTGDCVSHATRNAGAIDWYIDALFGETQIPAEGFSLGEWTATNVSPRLATEPIYGYRGHGGQGANCGRLASYIGPDGPGGFLLRAKWTNSRTGQTIDLSRYDSRIGHNWGRPGTPSWVNELSRPNRAVRLFRCTSLEMARDASAMGFGIQRCWGGGFSSRRDEHGFANQQGSWAHAEAWIGFDDTDLAHRHGGGPCPLEQNSWGTWNSGPKRADQPDGSYWMFSRTAQRIIDAGAIYIVCSVSGYNRELSYDRASDAMREFHSTN